MGKPKSLAQYSCSILLLNTALWSWRGSNPRPNKEPSGFLHAYLSFIFEYWQGERDQPKPYPQYFRTETGEHSVLAHLF